MKTRHILLFTIMTVVYFIYNVANATTKIAVIDTGFNMKYKDKVKLCKTGHKDFTKTGIHDNHGHGTHIAGLIGLNTKKDYCLIIIKNYDPLIKGNVGLSISAIKYAISQRVDMINYSAGGIDDSPVEKLVVKEALDKGIVFVAAAGNEGMSYKRQTYYPAMYDKRIVVVGNGFSKSLRAPSSNFGTQVDLWVEGTDVNSINNREMTGTSQSTAIVTGRLVKEVDKCKKLNTNDYTKCSIVLLNYMAR